LTEKMRNWKVIGILVFIVAATALWASVAIRHDIIVLTSGETLYVDSIWTRDDAIFYIIDTEMDYLEPAMIEDLILVSPNDPATWPPALSAHAAATVHWMTSLVQNQLISRWRSVSLSIRRLSGLSVLAVLLAGFLIWRLTRKRSLKANRQPAEAASDGIYSELAGQNDISSLFLQIFRYQIKAEETDPSSLRLVSTTGGQRVVEFRIRLDGKWRTRRMTFSPLGESSGSKSQCYHVIFDTHMVVKIPPKPITAFSDYLDELHAEARIQQSLDPRECVIPNLSVILKKFHTFPDADRLSPEQLEERYIQWLADHPEFRSCLKLKDGYIFFMDVARYFFMGTVLASFHEAKSELAETVQMDAAILMDLARFEEKYGEAGVAVYHHLLQATQRFHREVADMIIAFHEPIELSEGTTREWVLSAMAGLQTNTEIRYASRRLIKSVSERLSKTVADQRETSLRYRKMTRALEARNRMRRVRPQMGEMATNLLQLLAWLSNCGVALRDLKPDNLLVAANPEAFPQFLVSAKEYTIGLIDLETAVVYGGPDTDTIPQPQLGGTPLYATPSHFFPNRLLAAVHGDLSRVLHLQDWYAMIAIIYESIVGERLFIRTARHLTMLMNDRQKKANENQDVEQAYRSMNDRFWQVSSAEFAHALELNAYALDAVQARVPEIIGPVAATDHCRGTAVRGNRH
jgi:hypothetical protein